MQAFIFHRQISLVAFFVVMLHHSQAQNVGIGTNTPSEKLDVAGNTRTDTLKPNAIKLIPNAGNGKILTSDAVGNASWQSQTVNATTGNAGFGVWGDCATNGNISAYQPLADDDGKVGNDLGKSVAISGNYAIIGTDNAVVGANLNQGSANIYQFNGGNWVLMQKLTDANGAVEDYFGSSVSISGNYAIVGIPGDDVGVNANQGSANIYWYNGSTWVFMQKMIDAAGAADDFYGTSVSVNDSHAIVGAPNDAVGLNARQGSACVYQYNGTSWVLLQKITDATGAAEDYFGYSVSVSGNYVVVGALNDKVVLNSNQGSASIYQYNRPNWVLMKKITDATGAAGDEFGCSVSISGNYAIIGAFSDDAGGGANRGSASIYQYKNSDWILMKKVTDDTGANDDYFGSKVSISGNYAIVGVSADDVGSNTNQGSAIIYIRVGAGWQKLQKIIDPSGSLNDNFGNAVGIDAATKTFLIGAFNTSPAGKVVFGKVN